MDNDINVEAIFEPAPDAPVSQVPEYAEKDAADGKDDSDARIEPRDKTYEEDPEGEVSFIHKVDEDEEEEKKGNTYVVTVDAKIADVTGYIGPDELVTFNLQFTEVGDDSKIGSIRIESPRGFTLNNEGFKWNFYQYDLVSEGNVDFDSTPIEMDRN